MPTPVGAGFVAYLDQMRSAFLTAPFIELTFCKATFYPTVQGTLSGYTHPFQPMARLRSLACRRYW